MADCGSVQDPGQFPPLLKDAIVIESHFDTKELVSNTAIQLCFIKYLGVFC